MPPSNTVGRYQLLVPLATGGMAEIWLAKQLGVKGFEKLVVIKRISGALEDEPEYVEMFLREARLAAQLNHPHIVQVYELGQDGDSFFIAMEFIEGETLSAVFKDMRALTMPIPDAIAARLVAWAADGLHHAHTRADENGEPLHIVHRDISPQNLLVTTDGSIKLVDFGIAKVGSAVTTGSKVKGKLAYMAPEQARLEAVDARADVFGLGVVLFELVTRTRLFPRMGERELFRLMATGEAFPRASHRREDLAPELDAIIARAMAPEPIDRYQSARDLQTALEEWITAINARASSSDVAAYVTTVLADRLKAKRQLIEAAKRGELTPSRGPLNDEGSDSNSLPAPNRAKTILGRSGQAALPESVDVNLDPTRAHAVPPKRSRGAVAGLGLLVAVVLGVVAFRAVRSPQSPVQPVASADAGRSEPAGGTLRISVTPAEATVLVDGQPWDGGALVLPPGDHLVAAKADGYQAASVSTQVHPLETSNVALALAKAEVPQVPPSNPTEKRPARGTLVLDTVPWTTVFFGGKRLGETPRLADSLPVGRHVLRLVNEEQGIDQTIEVVINANTQTVRRLRLK